MLRCILLSFVLFSFTACDFDVSEIFKVEGEENTEGDGQLVFYRPGQVVVPVPPAGILTSNDVQLGYILVFRPGPSGDVPTELRYRIRGLTDKSLPSVNTTTALTYVPAPPPSPEIEKPSWCVFDPIPPCDPLFMEATYQAGDFYYAVIIENMGQLLEGDHDFIITVDPDDDYTPEDDLGTAKSRTLTVSVASTVYAN